jgi:hypothetical protein
MKNADIKEYTRLRDQLAREREEIQSRLLEIGAALDESQSPARTTPVTRDLVRSSRRQRTGLTLRDAVTQVLTGRSLTKEEILTEVRKLGYAFTGAKPMNSLGVFLYRKPSPFAKVDGRFSLGGTTTPRQAKTAMISSSAKQPAQPRKRIMSEEQKRKISETMRKRAAMKKKSR